MEQPLIPSLACLSDEQLIDLLCDVLQKADEFEIRFIILLLYEALRRYESV